jgi:hypothetical protein
VICGAFILLDFLRFQVKGSASLKHDDCFIELINESPGLHSGKEFDETCFTYRIREKRDSTAAIPAIPAPHTRENVSPSSVLSLNVCKNSRFLILFLDLRSSISVVLCGIYSFSIANTKIRSP